MTEYTEQEEELARVEADIDILNHENKDYQERLRSLQMKIEEKKREIRDLEFQIKEFENTRVVSMNFPTIWSPLKALSDLFTLALKFIMNCKDKTLFLNSSEIMSALSVMTTLFSVSPVNLD